MMDLSALPDDAFIHSRGLRELCLRLLYVILGRDGAVVCVAIRRACSLEGEETQKSTSHPRN